MKKVFLVITLAGLISCNNRQAERDALITSAMKVRVTSVEVEEIYEMNQNLILAEDSTLKKVMKLFTAIDDTLRLVEGELISTAGGLTPELGDYMNLPAKNYVNQYFHKQNNFRDYGYKIFFDSLHDFFVEYKKLNPQNSLADKLIKRLEFLTDHYDLAQKEALFHGLTLDEAVQVLESFRVEIALEQTRFLIEQNAKRIAQN